ncbi:MAG: hypothetical protein KGI79_01450, partial [Patescibacteria group bacterium]|nr:hypothetical protein [Patescibacteria group bacterium]
GAAYIHKTFAAMDEANAWEAANCAISASSQHAPARAGDILAHKSFGHALGPLIMLMRAGHRPGSTYFRLVESFFRNYIAAKQMSDDAHDWEQDARQGRLNSASSVIADMLSDTNTKPDARSVGLWRDIFWDRALDVVVRRIMYRIESARTAAKRLRGVIDYGYLESLISPLERSAERALSERNEAARFLWEFRGQTATESERQRA